MYEGIIQRIFRDAKELPVLLPEKYALEAGTRSGDFFSVFFSAASFSPVPVHLLIFYISFSNISINILVIIYFFYLISI